MITGIYCRNKEIYEGLKKEIKMFEQQRVQCDVTNIHQFDDLYRLLYIVQAQIIKEEC